VGSIKKKKVKEANRVFAFSNARANEEVYALRMVLRTT
jgi:hypothetical protein